MIAAVKMSKGFISNLNVFIAVQLVIVTLDSLYMVINKKNKPIKKLINI